MAHLVKQKSLSLLLVWISEGCRNPPVKSYWTRTEENGPLDFLGFPQSAYEELLDFLTVTGVAKGHKHDEEPGAALLQGDA